MAFLCLTLNLNTGWGPGSGDGAPLYHAVNCEYVDASVCTYARGVSLNTLVSGLCEADLYMYIPGRKSPDDAMVCNMPLVDRPIQIYRARNSTASQYDCAELDLTELLLIGVSVTDTAGNLACAYGSGALCTYSEQDGTLASGSGNCPSSVISSTDCPIPSSTYSCTRPQALLLMNPRTNQAPDPHTAAPPANPTPTPMHPLQATGTTLQPHGQTYAPSPLLITVLALTVFLVLGALVLGGVWFAQGRGGGARYQRAAKHDFVEGASMELSLDSPVTAKTSEDAAGDERPGVKRMPDSTAGIFTVREDETCAQTLYHRDSSKASGLASVN
ncbi:hypothetical protein B0H13DRAFT_1862905 [Mycena leptocephala]|nr:hypothetical protein B0H13DRAFT_1862905 [Mycena leptocephala]